MRGLHSFLVLAVGCGLGLACACGSSSPSTSPPADAPPQRPSLVTAHVAAYLPADTELVVAADSIRRIADAIGWQRAWDRNRQQYEELVAAITQLAEHNLMDPLNLAKVGIEPDAPWGVAVLSSTDETIAVFATLRDAEQFKMAMYRVAPKLRIELAAHTAGDGLMLKPDDDDNDWAIAMRGDVVFLVFTAHGDDRLVEVTRGLLTRAPADSLAVQASFTRALGLLGFGRDLSVYTSTAILHRMFGNVVAAAALPVAIGFELDPLDTRIKGVLLASPDTPPRSLVRNSASTPAIMAAVEGEPVLVATASLDMVAFSALEPVRDAQKLAKSFLQLDLDADVLPLLTGDVGVAMMATNSDLTEPPALAFAAQIKDEQAARAVLDRVVPALGGKAARGGYVLGGGDHAPRLGIAGGHVIVATDARLFDALARNASTPALETSTRPLVRELLANGEVAGRFLVAGTLAEELFARRRGRRGDKTEEVARAEFAAVDDNEAVSGVPGLPASGGASPTPDPGPVPESPEYRAKEQQLEQARAKLIAFERAAIEREATAQRSLARALGGVAVRIRATDTGLVIDGGYHVGAGGLPGLFEKGLTMVAAPHDSRADDEWSAASEHVHTLERELAEIRARDRDAHLQRVQTTPDTRPGAVTFSKPSQVAGALSKDVIRRVVRDNAARVKHCYEVQLGRNPRLVASIKLAFSINGEGEVFRAEVTGQGPAELHECIGAALEQMKFPRPNGGGVVRVVYPMMLRPS